MREILFRGKRVDNGEWVEGYYYKRFMYPDKMVDAIQVYDGSDFGHVEYHNIIPETLGQYTGDLTDKNSKRIFEGDILAFPDVGEDGYEYKEGYDFTNVATVCWNNGRWELQDFGDHNSGIMDDMKFSHCDFVGIFGESEVIGNIHDNPELIQEVE
jgi:uncharacterized phage protein (TIGR01671 family)